MNKKEHKLLDFNALKPYQKRAFVPENAELTDVSTLKKLFAQLQNQEVASSKELEEWILSRSEFEAAFDQKASGLYIRMTCQTDNKEYAQSYQDFIEKIIPVIKPLDDQLNQKFLKLVEQYPLDPQKYGVYIKAIKTDVDLFTEANIELEKKVGLLSQEYQAIIGKQTVEFEGREQTMPQMGKYLLDPDRALRQSAWEAMSGRRLQDKDKLDDVFDQMLQARVQISKNAGFDNFVDYKFQSLHRFDYTSEDCKEYHQAVEKAVLPLWNRIQEKRKEFMGLDSLRPWDTAVDSLGRKALKPFDSSDQLVDGCKEIFTQIDERLGVQFDMMHGEGLLDLESRKGKAPGGYQSTLNEARKPFIFMNAVGVDNDVRTLLHEGGHAFHALACRDNPILDYRHGPMEFCEVASMSMELLADEHLSVFYDDKDKERSVIEHLEGVVYVLLWVAVIDAFQHWIYTDPDHSREDRAKKWIEIKTRFLGSSIDWSGCEEHEIYAWHRQLHIFEVA